VKLSLDLQFTRKTIYPMTSYPKCAGFLSDLQRKFNPHVRETSHDHTDENKHQKTWRKATFPFRSCYPLCTTITAFPVLEVLYNPSVSGYAFLFTCVI